MEQQQSNIQPPEDTNKNRARTKAAKQYASIKNRLFLVDIIITVLGLFILIMGGISGISGRFSAYLNSHLPNIYLINGVFVVVLIITYTILFLPLSLYQGYFLECRFRLSTQSIGNWFRDKLKSLGISVVLSLIVIQATYLLLRRTGSSWWIWAGILWIFFSIILNHLAPVLLIPIFYKLTPLNNPDLETKLIQMAQKAGARIVGIFKIDLSRKTKKANAAFTGMGRTKRILLSDTLLARFSHRETGVILAHELGHYYYQHLWKLLGLGIVTTFIGLWIVNQVLSFSVSRMGFTSISDIGTLPLFSLVLFIFMLIIMPVNNLFSRCFERQADKFSIETTDDPSAFISSMEKLSSQNLTDVSPNPIIHFIMHSHPSIKERIAMARSYIETKQPAPRQHE